MALTVVATVGASNANSYNTIAGVTSILEGSLWVSNWNTSSGTDRAAAIVEATTYLEAVYTPMGKRVTLTQALSFPRFNLYHHDTGVLYSTTAIPDFILKAHAYLSDWWLGGNRLEDSGEQIEEVSDGVMRIRFASGAANTRRNIPGHVLALLRPYGQVAGSGGTVKLRRG